MQPNYGHIADMGCIFSGKMGMCVQQPWQSIGLWSVADRFLSTFSFILICAPSLSPQPCRKRSVTLGDCPATHLSNFTLLSSHPFYGRLWASSRLGGNPCRSVFAFLRLKTVWLPLFFWITLRAEEKVLCLRASFLSPYGYDNITLCRTCCYYKRPPCSVYVEDS